VGGKADLRLNVEGEGSPLGDSVMGQPCPLQENRDLFGLERSRFGGGQQPRRDRFGVGRHGVLSAEPSSTMPVYSGLGAQTWPEVGDKTAL